MEQKYKSLRWSVLAVLWSVAASAFAHSSASHVSPETGLFHFWTELHHGAPVLWLVLGLAALAFLATRPLTKK
jgi:hypothetical protein